MKKDTALFIAGIVFAIIASVHLIRVIFKFNIIVANYDVPIWMNFIGFIIAFILAVIMFQARKNE